MDFKPVVTFGSRVGVPQRCVVTRTAVPDAVQPGRVYCCGIGTSCTFIASATDV